MLTDVHTPGFHPSPRLRRGLPDGHPRRRAHRLGRDLHHSLRRHQRHRGRYPLLHWRRRWHLLWLCLEWSVEAECRCPLCRAHEYPPTLASLTDARARACTHTPHPRAQPTSGCSPTSARASCSLTEVRTVCGVAFRPQFGVRGLVWMVCAQPALYRRLWDGTQQSTDDFTVILTSPTQAASSSSPAGPSRPTSAWPSSAAPA